MKTFFKTQGLWEIVDEGFTTPSDTSILSQVEKDKLARDMEKDNLALYNIQMAMADPIFPRISGATSAKEAWNTLKEEFQGNANVQTTKLQTLRRDLENMKMKDSETKILISLPKKYDPIVTTTEDTKDLATLSVTELVGSLEAYEKRLSRRESDSMENAFQSKLKIWSQNSKFKEKKFGESSRSENSRIGENGGDNYEDTKPKYPPCRVCKKTSYLEKDCWFRGKLQCRNCGKFGHAQKDFRSRQSHHANFTEQDERKNYLFYPCHAVGCSNHMTSNEEIF
ncbi:hypothetical protein ABFS83_09G054100 [Erythranthe nasuta]